jgi:hypothetical protein
VADPFASAWDDPAPAPASTGAADPLASAWDEPAAPAVEAPVKAKVMDARRRRASDIETRLKLPPGLLVAAVEEGLAPPSRQAVELGLKVHGIDARLSEANAIEVQGIMLRDQLKRSKGDAQRALMMIHGGDDPARWNRKTADYVARTLLKQEEINPPPPPAAEEVQPATEDEQPTPLEQPNPDANLGPVDLFVSNAKKAGSAISEMVTGASRMTPEVEAAQEVGRYGSRDFSRMPEVDAFKAVAETGGTERNPVDQGVRALKAGIGKLISSPDEAVKIIQEQFPGVEVRRDEKGNTWLRSAIDGQEYVVTPGMTLGDVETGIVQAAPFVAATMATGGAAPIAGGVARAVGGAAARGAVAQGGIEAVQSALGGDVDPEAILAGAAVEAGGQVVGRGIDAVRAAGRSRLVSPYANSASKVGATPLKALPAGDIAKLVNAAEKGDKEALAQLVQWADIDAEAAKAAKRLGVSVDPTTFARTPQAREVVGYTRGGGGSEAGGRWKEQAAAAGRRIDTVLEESVGARMGASGPQPAIVSDEVKASLEAARKLAQEEALKHRLPLKEIVPDETPMRANATRTALRDIRKNVDSKSLTADEKRLIDVINDPDVKYGTLVRERSKIGSIAFDPLAAVSPAERASLKKLYAGLSEDLAENVSRVGGAEARELFDTAEKFTAQEFQIVERLDSAFGKGERVRSITSLMDSAIKGTSKGDGAKMAELLRVTPTQQHREVVATALANAARTGEHFSPKKYVAVFDGISRGEGSAVSGQVRKALGDDGYRVARDIATFSRGMSDAENAVLKTGATLKNPFATAPTPAGAVASWIVGKTTGLPMVGRLTEAGMEALLARSAEKQAQAAGRVLASEEFRKMALATSRLPVNSKPAREAVDRLATSSAWREFLRTAKVDRDPKVGRSLLTSLIQSARNSLDDEEDEP